MGTAGAQPRGVPIVWPSNFELLAGFDIAADGLGLTLHGFGGDLDTGQQFQLFAALFEAGFAAHHRYHASHSGRTGDPVYIQFPIARRLTLAAMGADVITALEFHWP
jgi:hypothetical protein